MRRVHPRVCGVDSGHQLGSDTNNGSSPRVGGRLCMGSCQSSQQRSIPRAWDVIMILLRASTLMVHPRVCGVDDVHLCVTGHMVRCIPSCAGQMILAQFIGRGPRVHPRICGGRYSSWIFVLPPVVHPCVCGADSPNLISGGHTYGFILAYAGEISLNLSH